MEKFTIANHTAFRYIDTEKGEKAILLIHGYLESIEAWDTLIPKLKKEYRIITFDVPGHGISEVKGEVHTMSYIAETAAALLDKIGVAKVTVIGHSMGGYIAQALKKLRPDLVEKMVLLHSTPDADTPEKRANREREMEIIRTGRKELLSTINPGKGFAKANRQKFDEFIKELEQQVMLTEDEGILALLSGMMEREDGNTLIDKNSMMVFGRCDEYMPVEYCESIAAKHPEATVLWLENSGHNGHLEEQSKFIEALTNFMNEDNH